MSNPKYIPLKNLEVYQLSRQLSKVAWPVFDKLSYVHKKVIGNQFISAVDSVGANIAEGYARYHYLEKIRFYHFARGSLSEAFDHWAELMLERLILDRTSIYFSRHFLPTLKDYPLIRRSMHIRENISLRPFNTFGLEAVAKFFVEVTTIDELKEVLANEKAKQNQLLILGGGSNLLLTGDFNGLVIKNSIPGREVIRETEDFVWLKIGAGENWHELVLHTIDHGWGGVENLSLIPGTVGAAPMQNIGAYGVEIKEVFDHLVAVNIKTGKPEIFSNEQCNFGYRESVFKNKLKDQYVIAEVVLKLTGKQHRLNTSYGAIAETLKTMNVETPTLRDVSNAVIKIRQSKLPDPAKIGNAGSFFKNPTVAKVQYESLRTAYPEIPGYELPDNRVKIPAAWLIEQCGWKGKQRDAIGVHKNQALVLVNYGGGKGEDLKNLAIEIKDSVFQKFGVALSTEVNMV